MGRPARYIPENKNGGLVEVSCRCIGGKALLTPGPNPFKFNELVAGIIGRALEISPLDLCSAPSEIAIGRMYCAWSDDSSTIGVNPAVGEFDHD